MKWCLTAYKERPHVFNICREQRNLQVFSLPDKKSDDSLKLFPKHVGHFQVEYDLENLRLSFVDVQECDVSGEGGFTCSSKRQICLKIGYVKGGKHYGSGMKPGEYIWAIIISNTCIKFSHTKS